MSPTSAWVYSRVILFCSKSLANCSRSFCRVWHPRIPWGFAPVSPFPASQSQVGQCRAGGKPPRSCSPPQLPTHPPPERSSGHLGALAPLQPEVHSMPFPYRTHTMGWGGVGTGNPPIPPCLSQPLAQFLTCQEGLGSSARSEGQPSRALALPARCQKPGVLPWGTGAPQTRDLEKWGLSKRLYDFSWWKKKKVVFQF